MLQSKKIWKGFKVEFQHMHNNPESAIPSAFYFWLKKDEQQIGFSCSMWNNSEKLLLMVI